MQNAVAEYFGIFGYVIIPIGTGILTSFFVEFLDIMTVKKIRSRFILLVVSAGFTYLILNVFDSYYSNLWEAIIAYLSNITIAVVFYQSIGPWTVKALLNGFRKKLTSYADKEVE